MTEPEKAMVPGAPRIAVEHIGAGPLAIFLHGIGGNRTNWRDQLPAFSRDFHAVAWDARGYGDSDDYEGPLDFGDFAADLRRVLDHFSALTPPAMSREMARRIPNAPLTIIEGVGHLSNIEQPEAFNRVVLDFLIEHRER